MIAATHLFGMMGRSETPSSANLLAAYGPMSGIATRPDSELIMTIRPPADRTSGRKARVTARTPM